MMEDKCSCSFCGNLTFGGLRIRGELICSACEGRLAQLQIEDEDYKDWLGYLRSMWSKWMKQS